MAPIRHLLGTLGHRYTAAVAVLRSTLQDPSHGQGGRAQLAIATVLLVPAWLGIAAGAFVAGSSTTPSHAAITMLSAIAGQLAVGGAGVCVLRAWATHEVAPGLAAAGFLAYGVDKLIGASAVSHSSSASAGQILAGACLVLAFGLLLVAAVHRPGAKDARTPMSLWAGLLVVGLAGLALINPRDIGILSSSGAGGLTGNLIVTAAWSGLALTAIYAGRREADEMKIWIGFTALCLAQGRLVFVVVRDPALSTLASQVLQTIAVALTLFGAIRTVQDIIATGRGRLSESLLALQSSEARRRQEADAHEEAVHSLRSAMTAISGATHLLVFGGKASLADPERTKLAASLQAALDRANRLLRQEWDGGMIRFSLLDVLNPIINNERAQGLDVESLIPPGTTVIGNPNRAYEVVATLFDNVRKHAPGSPVCISVTGGEDWTSVVIEDRGPGIPAAAAERIFERGWSTSARCDGLGLGLYVARTLMEEQGGDLTAGNRVGGGARFEVRFPAGDSVLASASAAPVAGQV